LGQNAVGDDLSVFEGEEESQRERVVIIKECRKWCSRRALFLEACGRRRAKEEKATFNSTRTCGGGIMPANSKGGPRGGKKEKGTMSGLTAEQMICRKKN